MRRLPFGFVAVFLYAACSLEHTQPHDAGVADAIVVDATELDAWIPNDGALDASSSDASEGDASDGSATVDAYVAPCGDPTLEVVVVDEDFMAFTTSIGVDGAGRPQIVSAPYEEATWHYGPPSSTWTSAVVPGTAGGYARIAVNPDGTAHVVSHLPVDLEGAAVTYSRRSSDGSWPEVETRIGRGAYPVVAVDGDGVPHIVYAAEGALRYGVRDATGEWATEVVPGLLEVNGADLAIGADGVVHVAVHSRSHSGDELVYAARGSSGIWSTEVVDAESRRGPEPSITVDGIGTVHIVYSESTAPWAIYYAGRRVGGGWTVESFMPGTSPSWNPHIALDDAGRIHVLFSDYAYNFWYATRTAAGTWRARALGARMVAPYSLSFTVDATGLGHVAYSRAASFELIYGTLALCP